MPQETELKLALHPHDLPRLLAHPLLAAQPPRRERLRNTYFDTATLVLMQQRLAVRERRIGRRTLLTVKTAGHSVGGLSQRGEWEAPTPPGQFDFAALVDDAALAQQLTQVAWQLVPVFRTDFTRRSWLLQHGGAQVEVALDQGLIITGDGRANHRQPILELELELKSGPVDALLDLAHTLALGPEGRAASGLRLRPTDRSKAERGYALFQGLRPTPVKAGVLRLAPEMHPVEAFQAIALDCLAHLQVHAAGALQAGAGNHLPDPQWVHQARVALRRLRSGLRLFRAHLPRRFVAHWSVAWKTLANQLGDARNWDVFTTERLPELLATHARRSMPAGEARHATADAVLRWADTQRRAAWQRAADALGSSAQALRLLAFTRALLHLPPAKPSRHPPGALARWARQQLARRHARLRREARHTRRLGPQGRHALRLRLKQLRYAQESLASLLPAKRVARSTAALVSAQELLGRLNDFSTAQALLARCPVPGAADLVALLQARLDQGLQALPALERQLERTPALVTGARTRWRKTR